MKIACDFGKGDPLGEIAIVDTFTKLIFGEAGGFSASEELIIQALRRVEGSVACDSHQDMGQYLRALGVTEMIRLVSEVQACLTGGLRALVRVGADPGLDRGVESKGAELTGR